MVGHIVKVKVDQLLGSSHSDYPENIYPLNYGYVEEKRVVAPSEKIITSEDIEEASKFHIEM